MLKMVLKIGHILLSLTILSFLITGISLFINEADNTIGVSSGIVVEQFSDLEVELNNMNILETDFIDKVDSDSQMYVEEDEGSDLEDRGTDATGLTGLVSKNILSSFLNSIKEKIPGGNYIITYLISFLAILISILTLRAIFGDSKI